MFFIKSVFFLLTGEKKKRERMFVLEEDFVHRIHGEMMHFSLQEKLDPEVIDDFWDYWNSLDPSKKVTSPCVTRSYVKDGKLITINPKTEEVIFERSIIESNEMVPEENDLENHMWDVGLAVARSRPCAVGLIMKCDIYVHEGRDNSFKGYTPKCIGVHVNYSKQSIRFTLYENREGLKIIKRMTIPPMDGIFYRTGNESIIIVGRKILDGPFLAGSLEMKKGI